MMCHAVGVLRYGWRKRASTRGETSTAITGPAPDARMAATGRLSRIPPSTKRSPFESTTGGATPGNDKDAKTYVARGPKRCTISSAVFKLAETQKNGILR